MRHFRARPRPRAGYTAVELLLVVMIISLMASVGTPKIMGWIASSRVDNAARVVAGDLRLASSIALRQGRPVQFELDPGAMEVRITDSATGDQLHRRALGAGSEIPLQSMEAVPTSVEVYPSRTTSGAIAIRLTAGDHVARVQMSSAAFIEVDNL